MKSKIVLILLFAGTVIAGCGSAQDRARSEADSTKMDSSMRQTTPDSTMRTMPTDTTRRDTVKRDTL